MAEQKKKELPIRSYDTSANRGRRTIRQAAAERALNTDTRRREGSGLDSTAREALEAVVAEERSKGTRFNVTPWNRESRAAEREYARAWAAGVDDPLAKLRADTLLAGERYMASLRKSGIVEAGDAQGRKGKQAATMSGLHQSYAQMMALSALGPLRRGVSAPAVVQTLGMASAMFLLSPNFRSVVKGLRPQVREAITGRIEARRVSHGEKARAKLSRLEAKGKGRSELSSKWQKRLDAIEHIERGHRDLFTPHSAALTEVALVESAYAAMRDPRVSDERRAVHIAEVQESFDSAMLTLNEYIEADGIDREDVSREARLIIGHRLQAEPELASVFAETGHGRFVRSDPKNMYIMGETEPREVWTGGFTDAVTDREVKAGSFSLRPLANRGEHVVLCARTLEAELEDATTLGELNDMFASYTAASVVRRYPGMTEEVDDPAIARRMGRAESMFASMRADGISQTDQRYVYAAAFVEAMENVGDKNPELLAQWEGQYGPQWRTNVQNVVTHYSDMGLRIEKERLVAALVDRGFDPVEAGAEVDLFQQGDEDVDMEPGEEPIATETESDVREAMLDDGFAVPALPKGLTKQDRALAMMDAMSDHIAADLVSEADREGFYAPGSSVRSDSRTSEEETWMGAEVFVGQAMTDWEHPVASAQRGREEIDQGISSHGEASDRVHRRRRAAAQMVEAMEAMEIPQRTRDVMMAAAYARGIGKMVEGEPRFGLVVEMHSVLKGGDGSDWADQAYRAAVAGTTTGQAFERDRAVAMAKVTAAQRDEVAVSWAAKDPARSGYAAWERQFDRLDSIEVVGQSKIGELDGPGPDSVRDQVAAEAIKTASDTSGSDRERRIRVRRNTQIRARINQDYNKGPSTGSITGLGKDDAQILQDEDPTLGY